MAGDADNKDELFIDNVAKDEVSKEKLLIEYYNKFKAYFDRDIEELSDSLIQEQWKKMDVKHKTN